MAEEGGQCAECGKPARFTAEQDGVSRPLCDRCVERATGMVGMARFLDAFRRPRKPAEACPYCGTTAESIEQTGLAGCPLCYEAIDDAWKRFGIVQGGFEP